MLQIFFKRYVYASRNIPPPKLTYSHTQSIQHPGGAEILLDVAGISNGVYIKLLSRTELLPYMIMQELMPADYLKKLAATLLRLGS